MTHNDSALHCQGKPKTDIVVDSSSPHQDTDPKNLRASAAIELNKRLVTQQDTGTDGLADLVTVIDSDSIAKVIYPPRDPAGSEAALSKIDSSGLTNIAKGLRATFDEIDLEPAIATSGRSAIAVLTDGKDDDLADLIKESTERHRWATEYGSDPCHNLPSKKCTEGLVLRQRSSTINELLNSTTVTGGAYSTITSSKAQ